MNPQILRRFIKYIAILTIAMFSLWAVVTMFLNEKPGDFYTREGDIKISGGEYEAALVSFNKALRKMPNHRGALMGRAIVFIRTNKLRMADAELTHLIDFLKKSLAPDDATGRGTLAAAYANRGIVHDREGRYKKALADYIKALNTDEDPLSGPGILEKIVYGTPDPSTVRERAIYIQKQLALPASRRLLRIPEKDKKQRMYKP
jgi:tetratricopeptide (TPR) repeat protein